MFKFYNIFYVLLVVKCDAARILGIFPSASISHQLVYRPITQELAKRGHEVVVITTDPAFPKGQTPKNLHEIDIHNLTYSAWDDVPLLATGNKGDILYYFTAIFNKIPEIIKEQLQSNEIQNLIKDKSLTFDLLLVELFCRPALGFSYIYKVPVIQVSSFGGMFGTFEMIGAPTNPNLYPIAYRQSTYNITFWENISELYTYYLMNSFIKNLEYYEHEILKREIHSNIPSVDELKTNVQMVFLNNYRIWDFNRPVPANVVYMSGIHLNLKKNLPKDLKAYLDNSKNGVVYMSLGTNSQSHLQPTNRIHIFLTALSKLPYNVLLKWHQNIPGCPKNIKIAQWFPQSDILQHPNIKVFVTQGGLQSTDEAIAAGVPLVGIPLLSDQWYNSEKYEIYKIGVKLDMETLTTDVLRNAIETVIRDGRYRENVIKLRSKMLDQAHTALQRAVWWIEHVLRHGGAHLQAPAAHMDWTEYYELELVVTIIIIFIISISASAYLIRKLLCLILRLFKKKFE